MVLSSAGSWVRLLEEKRMTNQGLRVPEKPVDIAQVCRAEEMSTDEAASVIRLCWVMREPMADSCCVRLTVGTVRAKSSTA